MTSTSPPSISVLQAGRVAAVCTAERVRLTPAIAALPTEHPDARRVAVKCLIAGAILRGYVDGPYDEQVADTTADLILADNDGEAPR